MPWPKAILEEFGLWPVYMPQGAVAAAGANVAVDTAVDAATRVGAVQDDTGDVALAVAERENDALTGAFGDAPPAVAPAKMAPIVPPSRQSPPAVRADASRPPASRAPASAGVHEEMPVWIDDDGDFAADAALWSVMGGSLDDAPVRPALPAVATLDWDALTERVAGCQLCTLCEKRKQTVFGVGDRNADWLLIGEAPGQQEDLQGEPFVGQAGKLLDNMLRAITLGREQNVYIANVLKCRPPNNRDPEPAEVEQCEPYLKRQVALLKPRVIVVMGRFAAQSILRTQASIASLRGRVHEYEGVPVIVTYHPAYLLRSLPDKAKAWTDWCLARATYESLCESTPGKTTTAH